MSLSAEPSLAQRAGARVLLLGGQDAPDARQLLRRFGRHIDASWPQHHVSALAWPTSARRAALESACCHALRALGDARRETRACWLPPPCDALLARGVTSAVAALDRHMHVENGRPRGVLSRSVYAFTRFSVDALYGELGRELVELTVRALREAPYNLVLAHSFGGTLALRAAWELAAREAPGRTIEILALGTQSGHAVVRSPLWQNIPRDASGRIRLPACVRRYRHFYSRSDAFVAAPALPERFADIEVIEVKTGGFTRRGFGHALQDYLATREVRAAVAETLLGCS